MAPQLNYYLQAHAQDSTLTKAPFVTIENVLPHALLEKVRNEIFETNDDPDDCWLRRDEGMNDLDCGDERWFG